MTSRSLRSSLSSIRTNRNGLQSAGDRRQHFCCAKHRPRVRQEHQFDTRALIQKAGQGQQSAGDTNDLQLASNAVSTLEAQHSRWRVCKLQSRWSPISFGLQQLSHSHPLCSRVCEDGTLLKYLLEQKPASVWNHSSRHRRILLGLPGLRTHGQVLKSAEGSCY